MEKNTKKIDYMGLLTHLIKDFTWPTEYLFKFIVPFEGEKLNQLRAIFPENTNLKHQESKTGKYISVTALILMDNPDDVIEIYQKAEKIENIISL